MMHLQRPVRQSYRPIDFIGKNPVRQGAFFAFFRTAGTNRFLSFIFNDISEIVPICRTARYEAVRFLVSGCFFIGKTGTMTGTGQSLRTTPPFLRMGGRGWSGTIFGTRRLA